MRDDRRLARDERGWAKGKCKAVCGGTFGQSELGTVNYNTALILYLSGKRRYANTV